MYEAGEADGREFLTAGDCGAQSGGIHELLPDDLWRRREVMIALAEIGPGAEALAERLAAMPGVKEIRPVAPPYPLVSREQHPDPTRIKF